MTDNPLLLQWQGDSVARGDYLISRGRRVPYAKRPTTLSLLSSGALPSCRATTEFDILLCVIDKDFFSKVSDEMKHERIAGSAAPVAGSATPVAGSATPGGPIGGDEPAFYDASLSTRMQLLGDEVKFGGSSGAFYAEHLAHALAARRFTLRNKSISAKNRQPRLVAPG